MGFVFGEYHSNCTREDGFGEGEAVIKTVQIKVDELSVVI